MAIVSVKETWEGRKGSFADPFNRQYTRVFRVETNSRSDGPIEVAYATGLPKPYDAYTSHDGGETDALALLLEIVPTQDAMDPLVWVVECNYSTFTGQSGSFPGDSTLIGGGEGGGGDAGKPGGDGPGDHPEQRAWKVSWGVENMTRALTKAYTQEGLISADPAPTLTVPILNSAGDPLAPIEVPTAYLTLTVTRTVLSYDPALAVAFTYALNSDTFLGIGPEKAQCVQWTAEQKYVGGTLAFDETIKIRFCPPWMETWNPEVLDAGLNELTGSSGSRERQPIYDKFTQQPVTEPVPLDNDGHALDREAVLAGSVTWLTFYAYQKRPFSALNLTA